MDTTHINNIKKKLKEDYNFIKNDGAILTNIARDLLTENDNDYQKTVDFIDTLSKKDIQNRMQKIMNDLETAGEISSLVKETIKKDNLKLDKLKQSLEGLENEYSELEDSKTELEKSIKDLQDKLELKEIEITSKIKSDQDKHDSHLASLENILTEKKIELVDIQNTLDSVFQNGYENEYNIEKCDYVLVYDKDIYNYGNTNHIYYLDVSKYCPYTINSDATHKYKNYDEYQSRQSYDIIYRCVGYNHVKSNLCFPINIKLLNNEYIIKTYVNFNKITDNESELLVIYITNFGRIIKSNTIKISIETHNTNILHINEHRLIDLEYNYNIKMQKEYDHSCLMIHKIVYGIKNKPDIFPLNIAPKLNYRMPRIFLDVIDAFHTQNNDLMQECCKKYLTITRTKGTDKQIIDNIEFDRIIRDKDLIIAEKDKIIENNNKHIEEQNNEIEKMKQEIAKLKSALSVFVS